MQSLSELKALLQPLTEDERRDKDELYAPVKILDAMSAAHSALPELIDWAERAVDVMNRLTFYRDDDGEIAAEAQALIAEAQGK